MRWVFGLVDVSDVGERVVDEGRVVEFAVLEERRLNDYNGGRHSAPPGATTRRKALLNIGSGMFGSRLRSGQGIFFFFFF